MTSKVMCVLLHQQLLFSNTINIILKWDILLVSSSVSLSHKKKKKNVFVKRLSKLALLCALQQTSKHNNKTYSNVRIDRQTVIKGKR